MKKVLIFLIVLSILCLAACSAPEELPEWDFSPSTPSGTPSGSNSGSTPSGSQPTTSAVAPAPDMTKVLEEKYNEEMVMTKVSIKEGASGKYTEKDKTEYFVRPVSNSDNLPSNSSKFPYVSAALDKSVYELTPAYGLKDKNPSELESLLGQISYNLSSIEDKAINFIRYIYVQSEGKLLLSITMDTSAIYQVDDQGDLISGGYVMRAYVKIEKCTLTGYNNLYSFLYSDLYDDSQTKLGNLTSYFCEELGNYSFVITPVSQDNTLTEGSGIWADIFVGIPLLDNSHSAIWSMLTTSKGWDQY